MRKILLFLLPLMLLFTGCEKEPGEGGRASIHGRVMAQNHQNSQLGAPIGDPYPMPEHRVYIIYGDGEYHDDDVRTGADGRFRFNGLRRGSYTIYTISELRRDLADPSGFESISRTVEITEKDASVDAGDLQIRRYRNL